MKQKTGRFLTFFMIVLPLALLVCQTQAVAGQGVNTKTVLKYAEEWMESNHSHNAVANGTNDDAIRTNGEDAMCLRCHDTVAYVKWAETGFNNDWETAPVHDAGGASGPNCVACHTSEGDDACGPMLRLSGETPMLLGGYKIDDAGTAAQCFVCHNSRRGERNDKAKPVMDHRAPHEGASADLIAGVNFYFVEVGQETPHMNIENSCVACHMDSWASGGGHSFKASWDGCAACHSDVNGPEYKKAGEEGREALKKGIDDTVAKVLQSGLDAGNLEVKWTYEDESEDENFTKFASGKVEAVDCLYFHGAQTFWVTIDGKKNLLVLKHIKIGGQDLMNTVQGQTIAKAGWNLYMFDHDRSDGAHNPTLHKMVVEASVKALGGVDLSKYEPLQK